MASPGNVNKVDMSLDDIIALNRKESKGRGRGRGRGQRGGLAGGGSSQGKPGGLRKRAWRTQGSVTQTAGVAGLRSRAQQRAQQIRQKARNTLLSQRRNLSTDEFATTSTNTQQQRGGAGRGRGRGRGARGGVKARLSARVGRGRGMAGSQEGQAVGARRGGRIKLIRALKTQGRGGRGRGRGKGTQGTIAFQQHQQQQQFSPQSGGRVRGRGRGRGRGARGGFVTQQLQQSLQTGGIVRGRGRGRRTPRQGRATLQHFDLDSASPQYTTPAATPSRLQVAVIQEHEFEPMGVELPQDFGAAHHTNKSLHRRFTPKSGQKVVQRMVLPNGRAVNYQN